MLKSIFCTHLCFLAVSAAFSQGSVGIDISGAAVGSTSADGLVQQSPLRKTTSLKPDAASGTKAGERAFGEGLFQAYTARTTGSWPEAVEIADVNNDGRKDVVMVTSSYFDPVNDHKLFVYLQDGDGNLQAPVKYPSVNNGESIDTGDFNNDGLTDVVAGGQSLGIFFQNGSGTMDSLVPVSVSETLYCKVGDFNNDGMDDLVTANHGSGSIKVVLQNPSGGFLPAVTYSVGHGGFDELEVGDLNNDSLDDVIIMSGQSYAYDNFAVLLQNASGTLDSPDYYDLPITVNANGIGIGDLNADGLQDVALAYGGNKPSSNVAIFLQNASGALETTPLSYPSYDIPEPVEVADVDRDGRHDVLTLHGGWNAMGVYAQSESGGLYPEVRYAVPYASHYNPQGFAIGDINRDGGPDVAIADYNQGLVLLYHVPVHTAADSAWGLYE